MSADIHSLSGAYAVDAVDGDERVLFEEHLALCPECRVEVASLREAASALADLTRAETGPDVRRAVLDKIGTVRPLPPLVQRPAYDTATEHRGIPTEEVGTVVRMPRRHVLTWAGAAAAAAVVGGVTWQQFRPQEEAQLTAAEKVIRASDAHRFQQSVDGHTMTIVRSPAMRRAVLIAEGMPAAPKGKDYQAWFDLPGQGLVSAGVVRPDASDNVMVILEGDAAAATGAGLTVEPTGGSPAPTSDPIMLIPFT